MANDGSLVFDTKINDSGFESGVSNLKKGVKGLGDQMEDTTEKFDDGLENNNKSMITLKNTAKIVGTYIAGKLFKDALTKGVEFNAMIESYTTSFEVMTGSAEKAEEIVSRLQKIGASTPFEFEDLASATQLLMNFGFSADGAIDSFSKLGDISQGNADKLNSIARAYGKMNSAQKVSLEDINMMIDAGFNPLQEISETTGESMRKLYDRISDGAISVDEITASIERSTSEGGKYFQSMAKQSATLNGRMSTLKDTVNNKLGEAFQGVSDLLRDQLIPFAIDFLENLDRYAPIILTIVGVLGTLISLFYIYNLQQALAVKGMTLWNAVCGIGASVTSALGTAFAFLTSPMMIIVGVIALIVGAIIYLWKTNEGFHTTVTALWESISSVISNAYETIFKPIINALTDILKNCYENGVKPLWEGFVEFVRSTILTITGLWRNIAPIVNWLIDVFGTRIADSVIFLGGVFGDVFIIITELLRSLLRRVTEIFDGIKTVFYGIIDFITGVFTGDWELAWIGVKEIFAGIFKTFGAIIKTPINLVITGLNTLIAGLNKISFDIPSWVPIIGGSKFGISIPKIPQLERGGILRKGQTGYLEGNGSEAVVPLDRNKYWIKSVARDMLQAQANQGVTNNNDTINVVFNDTQTSPDAIARKIYQMKTYGLARGV